MQSRKEFEKKRKTKSVLGFTDASDYENEIKKANEIDNKKSREKGVELNLTKPYRYWQLLEFCIHKYKTIKQIIGYFRLGKNKRMCAIGLTNYHVFDNLESRYSELELLENVRDKIEKKYEDLLFTTEIEKCPYCDDFTLDKQTVVSNNDIEIRYDRQTNKLVNFVQHLNDKHKFSFTKILNVLKKFNY